jgi:antibiotic biosynthesis monooxygenase
VYAVVSKVSIPSEHVDEALEHLKSTVVPRVKQAPGLVAGYWVRPQDGHGLSIVVFETEDAARAAADMAENAPRPDFVTFDSIEVREVAAQV